ncbi:MAG: enoyl-CoA hydratase/isomerase family protein [Deltaproteobacteria bacterium]|nr:enoyl-CoA hydratase/isomerase family protein [Deltaproteobacteria bacterium]
MSDFTLDVADGVAVLTLNRPTKKNALTLPMVGDMADAVAALHDRDDVNVLVLTGAGGEFCAGADLIANAGALQGGADAARTNMGTFHKLLLAVWNFPRATLAAVAGDAVGFGMDLSLACDVRIGADTARFSQGFGKIALVPDGGSSLTLARLVGLSKALELFYFSPQITSGEALRIGLLNQVVPASEHEATWRGLAAMLATGPQKALRLGKANIRKGLGITMEEALANEADAQVQCLTGTDPMVGVMSWMNKTAPTFTER